MMLGGHLPRPCLALVTDRRRCGGRSLPDAVALAVEGGVGMVQLRENDLSAVELLIYGQHLRYITKDRALLFINNRPELALTCKADGVHLPERGLNLRMVRRLVGDKLIIGRSVHSVESAVAAERDGADYLIVGTIYETASHPGGPVAGPQLLRAVREAVSIPILGIGGITSDNIDEVMAAGADGAAVISAILSAPDPRQAAADLSQAMLAAYAGSSAGESAR